MRINRLIVLCLAGAMASPIFAAVPAPWSTPVATDSKVAVWGREYAFASNALPVSVKAQGRELLAGPMRVVCKDSDGNEVRWTKGGSWIQQRDEESVTYCAWQSGKQCAVDAAIRVEFDGMMKLHLALVPGPDKRIDGLTQAWLEIPFKPEVATLFNFSPCDWGKVDNYGTIGKKSLVWPYRCAVWIGDEKAGFSWFCESDEKFVKADEKRVIEVLPGKRETVLRIRLADGAFEMPRTWVFGMEATPVKPYPKAFNANHTMHSPEMGVGIVVKRPEVWWTAQRAFPHGDIDGNLKRAAELGVKTIAFHEDWIPVQNCPMPRPDFQAIVDKCHRLGIKVLVYDGFELSPLDPLWGECCDTELALGTDGKPVSYWYREPGQRDYRVCYRKFGEVWLKRAIANYEKLGIDGYYLDGTIMPRACCNERHGCGWRDAKGALHPTYPFFAVRKMMRGLYEYVNAKGGRIDAHQSGYVCPATLGFAHSYWDGEQFACGGEKNPKLAIDVDGFRAEFMGVNHGVPCEFLAYEKPGWSYDDALAVTLLHNVMVRPYSFKGIERMAPLWKRLDDFGFAAAEFHPYYDNGIQCQPEKVRVSYWQRRDGKCLYVVSNLDAENEVQARVLLPGGVQTLSLKPFEYRLIEGFVTKE